MIAGVDKPNLENIIDKISDILNNLGLFLNHAKTECMATYPPLNIIRWLDDA